MFDRDRAQRAIEQAYYGTAFKEKVVKVFRRAMKGINTGVNEYTVRWMNSPYDYTIRADSKREAKMKFLDMQDTLNSPAAVEVIHV